MIGKDEEQEVSFKVADRRKFNADGSVKDGVTLDAKPPERPVEATRPIATTDVAGNGRPSVYETVDDGFEAELADDDLDDVEMADIPGAKDPASFVNFLSFIATNAATSLGAVPHPTTGQRMLDLDGGKYWLDVIAMLKEKTKGNLHAQEERLVDGLLADLRMQYVHLVKATEEKLKSQAAQKLSGDDILGKR